MQWRKDRPCYPCYARGGTLGGGILPNLLFFKRQKYLGGQKAPGGQEAYKKNRKKSGGGGQKNQQGAPNGNVTPLSICYVVLINYFLKHLLQHYKSIIFIEDDNEGIIM